MKKKKAAIATIIVTIIIISMFLLNYKSNCCSKEPYCSFIIHNQYSSMGSVIIVYDDYSLYFLEFALKSDLGFEEITLKENTNNLSSKEVRCIITHQELSSVIRNNRSGYLITQSEKSKLNDSESYNLTQTIDSSNFFSLNNSYLELGIFDISDIYVTIWEGDDKKTVREYGNAAPEECHNLSHLIWSFYEDRWFEL